MNTTVNNDSLCENVNYNKGGYIVRSIAGRDKHRVFLVLGMLDNTNEGAYALVVDGKLRKCKNPKKKKLKHSEFVFDTHSKPLQTQVPEPLTNKGVQKLLKDLLPHN